MEGLSLICEFVDPSVNFAYGFEAGRVYESMRSGKEELAAAFYHYDNVDQLVLLANRLGYTPIPVSKHEGWVEMKFKKNKAPDQE